MTKVHPTAKKTALRKRGNPRGAKCVEAKSKSPGPGHPRGLVFPQGGERERKSAKERKKRKEKKETTSTKNVGEKR